jgi:cytochrome c556
MNGQVRLGIIKTSGGYAMRLRVSFGIGALLLAAAGFGQSVEEFQKLMRPAAAANGKLQKTIGTDLAAAPAVAAEVRSSFQAIEAFWAKHNVADAQTFSKNIQQLADEVESAAKAGNQDGAAAAAKKIGANCQGCHMAHRDKGADGSFIIK